MPIKKCPVCWAPIQTVLLHKAVSPGSTWDSHPQLIVFQVRPFRHHHHHQVFIIAIIIHVQITAHVLAYTNSCLNPLLYAKMSNNFRRGFSQVNGVTFSCDLFNLDLDLSLMLEEEGKQSQFKRAAPVKATQKNRKEMQLLFTR